MKPFPMVLAGTVAALAAVVGLHPRTSAGHALPGGSANAGSANAGSANSSANAGSANAGSANSSAGSTPTNASPSTTTPPPAAAVARSSTGPLEQYGYGQLNVRVTITGNTITHLAVPTLQTAEQYSQQLATQVIPMLTSEVLKAQSININGISGATYTAEAYVTSLQSALKTLHFR